jgi:hypothetical protein
MTWGAPESTSTESIQGIEFQIDKHHDVTIGHAWVGDKASGTVFGCVEEGHDWPALRERLIELMSDITEYIREEEGQDPAWVGLGSDYTDPPKVGAPETWRA